jgi:phosphate transport system substrate-binding protein
MKDALAGGGAFALAVLLAGCASLPRAEEDRLRLAGSDTMKPLAERWAIAFMERHPGTVVVVEGGGTATGIASLVRGRVPLATGSRPLLPEEVRELAARHGTVGLSVRCARDGLSVFLHPENPVRDLGFEQLKALFSGRIANWQKVGGRDAPVHLLIRPPSSGTHRFFRDLVLREEPYSQRATVLATTEAIVEAVRADRDAVGYGGVAFGPDLVHCSIDSSAPTPENVRAGTYPLGRYLYLHAVRPPVGLAARFVAFVLGDDGQRIVGEAGFVPLWPPEAEPFEAP